MELIIMDIMNTKRKSEYSLKNKELFRFKTISNALIISNAITPKVIILISVPAPESSKPKAVFKDEFVAIAAK